MKRNIIMGLIVVCMISTSFGIQAQDTETFKLNSFENEYLKKAIPGSVGKHFYSLNEEVFTHPEFKEGAVFEYSTGAESVTQFVVSKKKEYLPGTISIIAAERDNSENVFTATYSNGRLNGLYHESHQNTVYIGYEPEHGRNFLSRDKTHQEERLSCGVHNDDNRFVAYPNWSRSDSQQRSKSKIGNPGYSPALLSASEEDSITIDLMLVYTDAAESWAATSSLGSIEGVISQAMALSQTALDNSGTGIEIRLVHAHKTDYDEESDGLESEDRLDRLTQNPDNPDSNLDNPDNAGHMNEVHDLRIQYGADVVSLLTKIEDTGGLGWQLGSTGGVPSRAFNLNRVQQVANGYTLIHEIGHNMGNAHSRTQNESATGGSGGLFHYSAGYQDETNDFHTVMAYADGLSEAPIFSSPDLSWQGAPTGTNSNQTPEDNGRSMRQIKRTVAGYLPSVENAPLADVSDNEITITMNREDEETIPFTISNMGESGLVWDVDFEFSGQTVGKQLTAKKKNNAGRMEPIQLENPLRFPANYSTKETPTKSSMQEEVLYTTSFESNEGFSTGSFTAISDWRALTNSDFMVSSDNPNSGGQHLRLEYDGQTNDEGDPVVQWMSAPFLGYQAFGEYEVTINFEVGGADFSDEVFDFYIYDGKTGRLSSAAIITSETIFFADLEDGLVSFFAEVENSANVTDGEYHTLRISFNTSDEEINYYFNGSRVFTSAFLHGITPGQLYVLHRNSISGTYLNVDDIEIKKGDMPYPWLSLGEMSGVAFEGGSSQVNLSFNTKGISAGTYETLMTINTNDPSNGVFEIPVTLEVNDVVSNEINDKPREISLEQNYPNPFNPSTTIKYTLSEAQNVLLEIFNIQGQKVTTLQNEKMPDGEHQVTFDASNLSSGIYMYRLKTASQILTRKMVLIK